MGKETLVGNNLIFISASFGAITNPIGSILSGALAEYVGRRRSIQMSALPFVLGWICLGLAQNVNWLYAGRLITGVAGGKKVILTS